MNSRYKSFKGRKGISGAEQDAKTGGDRFNYPGADYRKFWQMFKLPSGGTRKVTIASDPVFLHVVPTVVGWVTAAGNSFPEMAYHRTDARRFSDDIEEQIDTGKSCLLADSDLTGAIQAIMAFWVIVHPYKYQKGKETKETDAQLALVEIRIGSNHWNIFTDTLDPTFVQHGSALGTTFQVKRWANDSRVSIGENWLCVTGMEDPATNQVVPLYTEAKLQGMIKQLNEIRREHSPNRRQFKAQTAADMKKVYPFLDDEQKQEVLDFHLKMRKDHNLGPTGWAIKDGEQIFDGGDNDTSNEDFFSSADTEFEQPDTENDVSDDADADGSEFAQEFANKASDDAPDDDDDDEDDVADDEDKTGNTVEYNGESFEYWMDEEGNACLWIDDAWVTRDGEAWVENDEGEMIRFEENGSPLTLDVEDLEELYDQLENGNDAEEPEIDEPGEDEGATEDDAGADNEALDDEKAFEASEEAKQALKNKASRGKNKKADPEPEPEPEAEKPKRKIKRRRRKGATSK